MSIIWAPHLGAWLANPLTAMFDGGTTEVEPQPLYSAAIAKRKAGKYREAIYDIQKELERFPTDFTGQMLLAEIQVENLNDVQGAQNTVTKICQQNVHPPNSLAYALNTLADWQLKYLQDPETARQTLERIGQLLPQTEYANLAAQRIAHLGGAEMHLARTKDARFNWMPVCRTSAFSRILFSPLLDPDHAKLASEYVTAFATASAG